MAQNPLSVHKVYANTACQFTFTDTYGIHFESENKFCPTKVSMTWSLAVATAPKGPTTKMTSAGVAGLQGEFL